MAWQLTGSPKSKRHFGGSVGVWKHLFHRSNLFYWVPYHVTLFPILWQWERGKCLSVSLCPLLFVVLHFPWYGRSFTYVLFAHTKFTGSPKFMIGAKAYVSWFSARTKVNNGPVCWSQQSTSCWACLCATYRHILQAHGCCSLRQNQHPKNIFPLVTIYDGRTWKFLHQPFGW